MKIKFSELAGELWPNKKESHYVAGFPRTGQDGEIMGFNNAIDACDLTVEVDEEKLVSRLKEIDCCNIAHLDTDFCELINVKDLAKALASNLKIWLKVGKGERRKIWSKDKTQE